MRLPAILRLIARGAEKDHGTENPRPNRAGDEPPPLQKPDFNSRRGGPFRLLDATSPIDHLLLANSLPLWMRIRIAGLAPDFLVVQISLLRRFCSRGRRRFL